MKSLGFYLSTILINITFIFFASYLSLNKVIDVNLILSLVIIVLFIVYFNYIVFEKIINDKLRKKFKYVIHINGIRGKSTTTRLIDAGLRKCGYKVFSKTTGTVPTMINTKNQEIKIKRLGNANIREQLKMIKLASKEEADILVLECMAVNPELQYICEKQILNADITVITNIRPDHIQDMGESLDDIAMAFSNTIPQNGTLVINDSEYNTFFEKKSKKLNSKLIIAEPYTGEDVLNTFNDNISIALGVAKALNLDENLFFEGMKEYHHDIGAFETLKYQDTIFLNGFSINDPVSIKVVYDIVTKKYPSRELTILLNNRSDRPTRILQHIDMMKDLPCKKLLIFGSNTSFVKNKLNKLYKDLHVEILDNFEKLFDEKIIFAVGNIGGKGLEIINYFREKGERI